MPGLVYGADMTSHLLRGYWPSYNVPFFKQIYEGLGFNSYDVKSDKRNGSYY